MAKKKRKGIIIISTLIVLALLVGGIFLMNVEPKTNGTQSSSDGELDDIGEELDSLNLGDNLEGFEDLGEEFTI